MIGKYLAQGSFGRRLVTRAIVVGGAVFVGGQVMRTLPHDQILIFPLGSSFPNAQRFSVSWQVPGSKEPSGGVTVSFKDPPPLQIRQHARLPNGNYIVTMVIESEPVRNEQQRGQEQEAVNAESNAEKSISSSELKTTVERRVNLEGGETMIALSASASVLE
ncbi:MAG: hypothetical protein ABUL62_00465 [Myxococcales bacterium]